MLKLSYQPNLLTEIYSNNALSPYFLPRIRINYNKSENDCIR